jgi:DNA (cytosine-5)-methyltransferase 1
MYWDSPANTITAYARNPASGRYVHPEQDRGLTIREAALLQGFPRRFTFEGSFDHKFVQIGNAVPPAFAGCLAYHLLRELLAPGGEDDSYNGADLDGPMSDSFSSGIAGRKRGGKRACTLELQ